MPYVHIFGVHMILSVLNSMCIRVALRVHLRCVLDAFRVHGDFAGCSAYRVRFRMHIQGAHRARLGCILSQFIVCLGCVGR